jgi:hypothetical protein
MNDNITIRVNNDKAILRTAGKGRWSENMGTIVNDKNEPLISVTFATRAQCIKWLRATKVRFVLGSILVNG